MLNIFCESSTETHIYYTVFCVANTISRFALTVSETFIFLIYALDTDYNLLSADIVWPWEIQFALKQSYKM